jgi:histidyl-tRNA synthetase
MEAAAVASTPRTIGAGSTASAKSTQSVTTTEFMSQKITAPRGTQDLIPPETSRWQALEARIHALARCFGYGEIRTPLFEATELFVRGVGETTDIVEKEMYTFADKSERSMTLRPEWTAPVVRAMLEHQMLAPGPQRLYYVGPIFRYERPQKGRYRQSHQFGVECTGYEAPEADAEVISLAWELVRSFQIHDARLKINSIGDEHCRPRYRQALLEHFRPNVQTLSPDAQRRVERNPLRLLDSKEERDAPFVRSAPSFESFLCDACREHFAALRALLDLLEIPYVLDPRIVRGLDYYTRTVFEIESGALGAQSAVCGGGRYDGLVASLGGPQTPAVGFALGMERFLMVVEATHGSAAAARSGVQAVALGAQARATLMPIVAELRRAGVPAFMDYADRKLLAHLKIADRNGARFALVVGDHELAAGEAVLRDLESRSDRRLPLAAPRVVAASLVEAAS